MEAISSMQIQKWETYKLDQLSLNLEMNDSEFTFTTEAKTESLWKALYDYSRSEKSTGNETDGQVINKYFSVTEKIKDEVRKGLRNNNCY